MSEYEVTLVNDNSIDIPVPSHVRLVERPSLTVRSVSQIRGGANIPLFEITHAQAGVLRAIQGASRELVETPSQVYKHIRG